VPAGIAIGIVGSSRHRTTWFAHLPLSALRVDRWPVWCLVASWLKERQNCSTLGRGLLSRALSGGRLIVSCNTPLRSDCVSHPQPEPPSFLCRTGPGDTQLPYRESIGSRTTTGISCTTRPRCKMIPRETVTQPALHAREGGARISYFAGASRTLQRPKSSSARNTSKLGSEPVLIAERIERGPRSYRPTFYLPRVRRPLVHEAKPIAQRH
jgi:hypothetical protein